MTDVAREWGAAVERQRGHRTHEAIAAAISDDLGITPPMGKQAVQKWTAGASIPSPEKVFALERALDWKPGTLSRILGYVPADSVPTVTVLDAIEADHRLSRVARQSLADLYASFTRHGS